MDTYISGIARQIFSMLRCYIHGFSFIGGPTTRNLRVFVSEEQNILKVLWLCRTRWSWGRVCVRVNRVRLSSRTKEKLCGIFLPQRSTAAITCDEARREIGYKHQRTILRSFL
jgi:hypothetical protein